MYRIQNSQGVNVYQYSSVIFKNSLAWIVPLCVLSCLMEPMDTGICVMKFGGASLATPDQFDTITELILKKGKKRLVVVVSAMGSTTDQLIRLAQDVNPTPPQRELDMLISVGERISMSLLAMALAKRGQDAISFTGSQSGIITSPQHSNAKIVNVRPSRIISSLEAGKIVIVAGFQGVSTGGEITTLGRGGTDTSAVALGVALNAEKVEFYKDVAGLYSQDPKKNPAAVHYLHATYDQALDIAALGSKILHLRSIQLAKRNGIPLHIISFNDVSLPGSLIHDPLHKRSFQPIFEEEQHVAGHT